MSRHYVLVDFENVQPRNLGLLRGGGFRIKVFLGSQQGKLDLDFVRAVQAFGGAGRAFAGALRAALAGAAGFAAFAAFRGATAAGAGVSVGDLMWGMSVTAAERLHSMPLAFR